MAPEWEHQEEPDLKLELTVASGQKESEILVFEKTHEKPFQETV